MTGYVVFDSTSDIKKGVLQRVSDPMMLMIQNVDSNSLNLSMSDPDLRLKTVREDTSAPSVMKQNTVTLQGIWALRQPSPFARIISATDSKTTIQFDCVDGKSIDISLVKGIPAS